MKVGSQQTTKTTDNKICQVCNTENLPEAKACQNCGASLADNSTTRTEPLERTDHIAHYTRLYPDSVLFFVMDEPIPILVKNSVSTITLGRNDPGSPNYHVDLTVYGALLLGVSRIHLRITSDGQTYMIEDLNSTNGTLLNGIRLVSGLSYMLRNGDQLEVGRMKVQMFFSEVTVSAETISLVSTELNDDDVDRNLLTLKDLATRLTPFLKLIEDLQIQIHRMNNRKPDSIVFKSLTHHRERGINVTLEGASGAIEMLTTVIMPVKAELALLLKAGSPEVERQIHALAAACVYRCARDLTATMAENGTNQFIPLLRAILAAPFDVLPQAEQRG